VPAAGGAVEARGAARPGAWFTFQSTVLTVGRFRSPARVGRVGARRVQRGMVWSYRTHTTRGEGGA
jgi:hypothetical protein